MKVVQDFPPNIEAIRKVLTPAPTAIFAYGDTIYNPSGGVLSAELRAHEEVHQRQQAGDPDAWWEKFLTDGEFRLAQELEAHRREYQHFCARVKDRNTRSRYLHSVATRLASPMYGNIISFREASRRISS